MGNTINTILLVGIAAAFLIGAGTGALKGLRKSIYRLITLALFFAIVFIFASVISKSIFNMPISKYLRTANLPDFITGENAEAMVTSAIKNYFGNDAGTEATELILAITSVFARIVYLVLMFTVVFWVYQLITGILYTIFLKGKRNSDGRKKKHRLIGAGIGGVKGIIIYFLLATVIITGPLSMVPDLGLFIKSPDTEEQTGVDTLSVPIDQFIPNNTLEEVKAFVDGYKSSIFYTLLGGDSPNSLSSAINDFIWTGEYGQYKVELRKEVSLLARIGTQGYQIYQVLDGEALNVDYDKTSELVKSLADSKFIMDLLPVAAKLGMSIESIQKALPEGYDNHYFDDVDWMADIDNLGNLVLDFANVGSWQSLANASGSYDLTQLEGDGVKQVFATLSAITFITKGVDVLVHLALQMEKVQEAINHLEFDLSSIIWDQEIKQLGSVIAAFIDVGISSFKGLDKTIIDTIDLDAANVLVEELFAMRFVDITFPKVMTNVVADKIKEESIRNLLDFEAVDEDGWEDEFITIINLAKEARGSEDDPTKLFMTDGNINFKVFDNLRTETILSSVLLSNATIQLLLDANEGKGLASQLSDKLVVPTRLTNKEAAEWKVYSYKCVNAYDDYKLGDTIDPLTYEALGDDVKVNWKKIITGGELYAVVDGLKTIISELGFTSFDNLDISSGILTTLDNEAIVSITDSVVLNASVTKMLLNFSSDDSSTVVVPTTAVVVDTEGFKLMKADAEHNELVAIVEAIKALDIKNFDSIEISGDMFADLLEPNYISAYKCVTAYGEYTVDSLIDVETYNALDSEEQSNWIKVHDVYVCNTAYGRYQVNDEITPVIYDSLREEEKTKWTKVAYHIYGYTCEVAYDEYAENDLIDVETYNSLPASEQANWKAKYTNLDKVIDSYILHATLSKIVINKTEGNDKVVIPVEVLVDIEVDGGSTSKNVTVNELSSLVVAVDILNLDFNDLDSLDYINLLTDLGHKAYPDEASRTELKIDLVLESDILTCTISKAIFDVGTGENPNVIIPMSVVDETTYAENNALEEGEIKRLISAMDKLDAIEGDDPSTPAVEEATIKADLDLVDTLLDVVDEDGNTKLDYLVGSDSVEGSEIVKATISSKIVKNSNLGTNSQLVLVNEVVFDAVIYDDTPYSTKQLINSEFRPLMLALKYLDITDNDASGQPIIDTGLDLVNDLLDYTDEARTTVKLDYIVGKGSITKSKILIDTISKFIAKESNLQGASSLVIPDDSFEDINAENLVDPISIHPDELRALVYSIDSLRIIDPFGNISPDLGVPMINSMVNFVAPLDPSNPNYKEEAYIFDKTPLEYMTGSNGSLIFRATISKYIFEQTSIIIPEDTKVYVDMPSGVGAPVNVLTDPELISFVHALNALDIVDGNNINTGLSLASALEDVYTYDPTTMEGDEVSATAIDYVVGTVSIAPSYILYATITDKILAQSSVIVPTVADSTDIQDTTTLSDGTTIIDALEMRVLVTGINKMDVIDGDDIAVDLSTVNGLSEIPAGDTKMKIDYAVASVILRSTISKYIIDEGSVIDIPNSDVDSYDSHTIKAIKSGELKAFIVAVNEADIISDDAIKDIDNMLSALIAHRESVSASSILRATIATRVNGSDVDLPEDAYVADTALLDSSVIKVLTSDETQAFLRSLSVLGITKISDSSIGLNTIFATLDTFDIDEPTKYQIEVLLESSLIWETISNEVKNFDDSDGSLTLVTDIYDSDVINFRDAVKSAYNKEAIYGNGLQTLKEAYNIERLKTSEIIAIIRAFKIIMKDDVVGDDFVIDSATLKTIYNGDSDDRKAIADAITESVILTKSVANLLDGAIGSVIPAGFAINPTKVVNNLSSIGDIEWRTYNPISGLVGGLTYDASMEWNDGQLYKLLSGLYEFNNFKDKLLTRVDPSIVGGDGEDLVRSAVTLNASRAFSPSLPQFFYNEWTTVYATDALGRLSSYAVTDPSYRSVALSYEAVFGSTFATTDVYTDSEIIAWALRNININRILNDDAVL